MTNQERAEKIEHYAQTHLIGEGKFVNFITSQLDEAVREVENFQAMRIIEVEKHCADNAFKYGYAAARDQAAWEIVEHCDMVTYIHRPAVGGKEWHVDIGNMGWSEADTAPMAICLAFLKLP